MVEYVLEWAHHYVVHFGVWVSFALGAQVTKNGIPEPKSIKSLLISAVVLSSIVSLFSSHSHMHYLSHFIGK
jgi:hypothetical protein